jgi:hypothetical protein
MSTVVARLSITGTLYANPSIGIEFDEITQGSLSVSDTAVLTGELDEVTGTNNGRAMQQINNGLLKVSGIFDEVTGILVDPDLQITTETGGIIVTEAGDVLVTEIIAPGSELNTETGNKITIENGDVLITE